jgi:hypothetical protein
VRVYEQISYLRYFNGSDTYYGGRDIYKLDPSVIYLFTDNNDIDDLQRLETLIIEKRINYRWDQQFHIVKLCLQGIIDRSVIDMETFRKTIYNHPSNEIFSNISSFFNGSFMMIESYSEMFQRL